MEISWTTDLLKKQVSKAIIILASRRVIIQVIQTLSTIFLARILLPQAFGSFAILVFLVEFLAFLPSQGFASSIIQKKSKFSETEVFTIFWSVLLVSIVIIAGLWLVAPFINYFYKGGIENGIVLTRLMAFSVLVINIRIIPAAILERNLKYVRLAVIDIAEIALTQSISIILVLRGWGIESLVAGYLIGKSLAAAAFYFSSPIKVCRFSFFKLKKFASFAFHYQVYFLTHSISGAIAPVYVGVIAGSTQVGYLSWAGGLGLIPWSFAELIGQVCFPMFSRVQNDKVLFGKILERVFDFSAMITFPFFTTLFVFASDLTRIVYSPHWLPAVWALRTFVLLGTFQSMTVVATNALLGIGQVKFVRNVTLLSSGVFWILALILIPKFGFIGQPIAWTIGSSLQFAVVFKIKTLVEVDYWSRLLVYWLLSVIAVFSVYFVVPVEHIGSLIFDFISILLIYVILVFVFRRQNLKLYWILLNPILIKK